MCAIDAIGSAFTFHQDTEIHSKCSSCGADVFVRVKDGKIVEHSPADLHALTFTLGEIANWAGSCWNAMNFFCKKNEMEQYIADMELDLSTVIQADMDIALKEAIATFNV